MPPTKGNLNEPRSGSLNLFDGVCLIVGTIVGAGIFVTPSIVASNMPNVSWLLATWALGGLIAVFGALCFAELTTTYPDHGGDYGYLRRAFGRPVGFAFSWTAFWVIRPGNIGAMAFAFGKYSSELVGHYLPEFWLAVAAVVLASGLNLFGVRTGKATQNFLAVVKIAAIVLLISAAAIFYPTSNSSHPVDESIAATPATSQLDSVATTKSATNSNDETTAATSEWFWLSMVFVMFAFGGWNDIAFVAGETRNPKKNLLWALITGTLLVVVVYLLINLALVSVLGLDRLKSIAGSDNQNAPLLLARESFGQFGATILGVSVCISCLGAISAMIFTSPRIYWATAESEPRIKTIVGGQQRGWLAILIQAALTVAMMVVFSQTANGFEAIVIACTPYFWLFLSLTVLTVFVNRAKYRGQFTGFRIPLYPLPPVLFILASGFMAYRAILHILNMGLVWQAFMIGTWAFAGFLPCERAC